MVLEWQAKYHFRSVYLDSRSISELVEELSTAEILLSSEFIKKTCLLKHLYPTICLLADYYLEKLTSGKYALKFRKIKITLLGQ